MSTHSASAIDQQPEALSFRLVPDRSEERQVDELGRKSTLSSRLKAVLPSRRAEKAHIPNTTTSNGEKTLEERRLVQLERRTLKESGDYLGVTGINPTTGELDVLTPSTTSFSSASLAIDQKLDSHKKTKTKTTNSRRGAAVLTEEVARKLQHLEEQRFSRKDQEKEAIRQAQRTIRWQRHRQQWSSAKGPILSPIAQSIKSISTRGSEAKDQGQDLPKVQEVQHFHQTEMGYTNPMSHLPKYLISEDDGADSSNTVIRTPQRRRSSFVTPEIDGKLDNGNYSAPAGVVKPAQNTIAGSPQVQITPSSPISEQIALEGSALDRPQVMKQAMQARQEIKVLASTEVMESQPLRVTCQFMRERQSKINIRNAVGNCSPRPTVTTSPSESSLMFQSPSVALDTWIEGSMTKHAFSKLMSDSLGEINKHSSLVEKPFMNQWMSPGAAESQESLPSFGAQGEKKDPTARHATTPITTTIGSDQGRFLSSPRQSQLQKKCSESWSLLQNRHISRQYDDRMSTSTEDISTESAHQLANVKRRTENLVPKGSLTAATRLQEAAIQKGVRKSFVKNFSGKELAKDERGNFVTSHMSTSTSPLNAREETTQWDQSEAVSLEAARAAVANSGSKMAQTRKRTFPGREDFRALPLSLRKPHADYVPFRRLRSSFNLMRRLGKSQQKSMEAAETNSGQSSELCSVGTGGSVNRQTTRTTSKLLSSTRHARSKAGYSTSNAPASKGSEGGGIEGRLRRETFNKHVLKCATDGKQMMGMLARWYWTVISPCFDPTSPARKRLDGNKSTWGDFALFLFALGSGFTLLAAAVRIAQGIALLLRMVHIILVGFIAILGS
ncbi:uncharacterized protein LY79DRAFT_509735 [Colletotrichum navitas]|uniref:Uncharacterized protein n=1 Tax=Colletotrichum navitas TaxID=681940 RepID=A0AAD8V8M7_9PEZI|nr:uncharacterized protein LY79DRAFT_509735 [Colletotrichum navitas]KAK1596448.1 hypothetical protein LY79DRAFT_509735 [Colletotrichum navitas]